MTYLVHQGKGMDAKKTMENNFGAENTIEMSLRLLGGMEKSDIMDMKDSSETEERRKKKKENWKKRVKTNRRERAKNQFFYKEK